MSSWNVSQDWTHFPLNHGWLGEQIIYIYIYNELSFEIFLGPVILMIRAIFVIVWKSMTKIHTKPAPWRCWGLGEGSIWDSRSLVEIRRDERSKDQGLTMGTKPSGDSRRFFLGTKFLKCPRISERNLTFDIVFSSTCWYFCKCSRFLLLLEHGFSLVNFLLTSQKEARPVDLAYPGNSWLVGSPKGETFCRETPQPQKRKRSKPWFAETEKGPNFSRKFIPACCKVARNCFGLTFWVTWRWRFPWAVSTELACLVLEFYF